MSFRESARLFALEQALGFEGKAQAIGMFRSVDATEAAKWLRELAQAIREACGDDPIDDDVRLGAQPEELEKADVVARTTKARRASRKRAESEGWK